MNALLNNKKLLVVLAVGIILLILVIIIGSFSSSNPPQGTSQTVPPLVPKEKSSTSVVTHLENRKTLSTNDEQVKAMLIRETSTDSSVVSTTPDYVVEYVTGIDFFHVQITTIEIEKARREAMNWFISQGMSKEGMCAIPIVFYLSPDVATQITGTNVTFNALPDGCQ